MTKRALLDANLLLELRARQPLSVHCSIRFAHSSRRAMRDHVLQASSAVSDGARRTVTFEPSEAEKMNQQFL